MKYEKVILVTGGAGFIGSNYLNVFVPRYPSYCFINIDSLTYAGKEENIEVKEQSNYIFEKADIRDAETLEKIFAKHQPTHIIHFAAETHVDQSIEHPALFVETNIQGTNNLLALARKYNLERFHQISTDEVYGSLKASDAPFTTASPILPNSPYSASKAGADMLVRAYHETFGLNVVTTRCSNNYGPYQDISKLIPKSITCLLQNKKIPIYAKGENIRDWIYVTDHIEAVDLVFHKGISGKIYNIGGNCEVRNIDIAKKLIAMTKKDESAIEFVADRLGHDYRYAINTDEMEKELGWQPKVTLEIGLQKTFAFYTTKNGIRK